MEAGGLPAGRDTSLAHAAEIMPARTSVSCCMYNALPCNRTPLKTLTSNCSFSTRKNCTWQTQEAPNLATSHHFSALQPRQCLFLGFSHAGKGEMSQQQTASGTPECRQMVVQLKSPASARASWSRVTRHAYLVIMMQPGLCAAPLQLLLCQGRSLQNCIHLQAHAASSALQWLSHLIINGPPLTISQG